MSARRAPARSAALGITLIELMVGMAVSLALMAGALATAGIQVGEHHRLMLELQVQQELRATVELMQRDIRRAGYWERAEDGLWRGDNPAPSRNPFDALVVDGGGQRLSYRAAASESTGFRFAEGRIDQVLGGRHQPLTDPALLRVRSFQASLLPIEVPIGAPANPGCARLSLQSLRIVIEAEALHDPRVRHRVETLTRLRNDRLLESCS